MCISCYIKNIAKLANFSNNVARQVKFGSFDSRNDVEHNGGGLVARSNIFATQHDFPPWKNHLTV